MDAQKNLTDSFQGLRAHLHAAATRLLGSPGEADDAVQETWIRLQRSNVSDVVNLRGWLTTVLARVCLDLLRARRARAEEGLDATAEAPATEDDPEQRALAADATAAAMLVVLETLAPAERVAFMMHNVLALPFEEIAQRVGRTPAATRQLASRARRRVEASGAAATEVATARAEVGVVAAFLAALRGGDVEALLAVLDPEFVVVADAATTKTGAPREVRGAAGWAKGAVSAAALARFSHVATVDGAPGLVTVMGGKLARALVFTLAGGRVARIEVVGDPERLAALDLAPAPD